MKRLVINCDKCGKEIEDNPARLKFYDTERDSICQRQCLYQPDEDYCDDCVTELIALIDNFRPKKKPEGKVKEAKKKAVPKKRKKTDIGKIWALRDAGWKIKDIAIDAECSPGTVSKVLQGERPVPEYLEVASCE